MFGIFDEILTTAILLGFYAMASFAVKDRWKHKILVHPLKIIASSSGRVSLSSAQVFFFTLIVMWLAIYWLVHERELVPINDSVLMLLGIAIVGSGVGKISDATRSRVTAENWAWAKKKKWIEKNFTRSSPERAPRFGDLLTTDRGFDIARFQAVGFSLLVGVALFYSGYTAENAEGFSKFTINNAYLILIGISQGAYVGGKYVGGNLFRELNNILDKVRTLEVAFTKAVADSVEWKRVSAENRNMALACSKCAPTQYIEYIRAAEEASEIVGSMTGIPIESAHIEPTLPQGI